MYVYTVSEYNTFC